MGMIGFAESTVSAFAEKVELAALHSYAGHGDGEQLYRVHRHVLERSVSLKHLRQLVTVTSLCQGDIRVPRALTTSTVPDVCTVRQVGHFIDIGDKQHRCQGHGCKSKPKTYCEKCRGVLYIPCFKPNHTK